MPCTADANCQKAGLSTNQTVVAGPNLQAPVGTEHFANMGWVGFVILKSEKLNADNILRVTTADVNLSQDITMPDVIDGRIDRTVYQLGPKVVEGTLTMPVIADTDPETIGTVGCPTATELSDPNSVSGSLLNNIWCWATARGNQGRLLFDDTTLDIRYANHAAFTFDGAVVNTLGLSVAQQDAVSFDINVIGRTRTASNDPAGIVSGTGTPLISRFLSPARVLTWNDVTINGVGSCERAGDDLFFSVQVREFNLEINNNADRFYSFNGSLFPIDVNVGKREITGSLVLMGLQDRLRVLAEDNAEQFTSKHEIRFAFYIGNSTEVPGIQGVEFTRRDWVAADGTAAPANAIFAKRLTGIVFRIEEMSMTNDLFETTVNFLALGNDQEGFEALAPSASLCSFPSWE